MFLPEGKQIQKDVENQWFLYEKLSKLMLDDIGIILGFSWNITGTVMEYIRIDPKFWMNYDSFKMF